MSPLKSLGDAEVLPAISGAHTASRVAVQRWRGTLQNTHTTVQNTSGFSILWMTHQKKKTVHEEKGPHDTYAKRYNFEELCSSFDCSVKYYTGLEEDPGRAPNLWSFFRTAATPQHNATQRNATPHCTKYKRKR